MCRSGRTRRTSAGIVLLAFTVLVLGGSAAASTWARSLTTASGPQGGSITISGNVSPSTACPPSAPLQLTSTAAAGTTNLFPGGLGPSVPRDAAGTFQATFVIPPATPVGSYTLGLRCGSVTVGTTQNLNVTAAPHAPASVTVAPTSATPGSAVTISGVVPTIGTALCPAGDAAQLTSIAALFPPDGFGPQVSRDANGNFRTSYTVPSGTAPGKYSIGVRCGGGDVGITAALQVTAAATTTTKPPSTTTTTSAAATTVAPTTVPPSTTVPVATTAAPPIVAKSTSSSSPLRWVALGVIVLVVVGGAALLMALRGPPAA
jgi:hypothetical protein